MPLRHGDDDLDWEPRRSRGAGVACGAAPCDGDGGGGPTTEVGGSRRYRRRLRWGATTSVPPPPPATTIVDRGVAEPTKSVSSCVRAVLPPEHGSGRLA